MSNTRHIYQICSFVLKFLKDILQEKKTEYIKLGPWGGAEGDDWSFKPRSSGVFKGIEIGHGVVIDSLVFISEDENGQTQNSGRIGGGGGSVQKIQFSQGEFLTMISGTKTKFDETKVVGSLNFKTNMSMYGPYGQANGSPFSIPIRGAKIVGFFGRCDTLVNAIGIYVEPSTTTTTST
ncbi:hypothetical protein EZV62_011577 [Acer yangbiense]|uniref:Jacalin-type lectin domain-containing protein n=1 Tax=Acer yangbiense TaxID=1000413 RepID=A0A5C7I4X9_9ROSI|nr:hypothetical protein EZV62_011577 [Acer yangbiense]